MKKVSIVVPVYNTGDKLIRCLDSILSQTHRNLQIILVDDGSKDDSLSLCRKYAAEDGRIVVMSHENHGVSYTRNRGIRAADGDYLMFLDADDSVAPDWVEQYLKAAEAENADIVVGGICFCEDNGTCRDVHPGQTDCLDKQGFVERVCENKTGIFGYVPNKLYRLPLIRENGIRFREDMAAQEDLEFALSAYEKGSQFVLISCCGYYYDYAPVRRTVPIEDLLGNQQKLLRLAKMAGVSQAACNQVRRKLQNMTYTYIFHCTGVEEMEALAKLPDLLDDLGTRMMGSLEQKWVLRLFCQGKYRTITRHFKMRNRVKGLSGKK